MQEFKDKNLKIRGGVDLSVNELYTRQLLMPSLVSHRCTDKPQKHGRFLFGIDMTGEYRLRD